VLVQRLHTVLRPFLLRRLKRDVEQQLPSKYEHIVMCRMSKRQRFLYDEFMSRAGTRETLASGNVLSILNCLMQLRKVCAHPDLFESRPIVSPFALPPLSLHLPATVVVDVNQSGDLASPPSAIVVPLEVPALAIGSLPPPPLQADPVLQSWLARLQTVSPDLAQTAAGRLAAWSSAAAAATPSAPSGAAARAVVRQRLPLTIEPPSWALIAAAKVPSRPCDRVQMDVRHPKRYDLFSAMHGICQRLTLCSARRSVPLFSPRYLRYPNALATLILSNAERAKRTWEEVGPFVFAIPPVTAPPPQVVLYQETRPWREAQWAAVREPWPAVGSPTRPAPATAAGTRAAVTGDAVVHRVRTAMATFFPDKHLLQYDCGKLQELDRLLRELKDGGHRVLIFSQMTRMLDILETFMNIHGHRYMRLDGATGPERRQQLVERFNADARIFAFILSTRSGGVGVNLTGADTVIFYDSDWNPAMDAQAQDRCHRIGQTRDVHVYRLITEHSVEENILIKANQKRAMDDMVIGDGGFTVDFFRQLDVRELFDGTPVAAGVVAAAPAATASGPAPALTEPELKKALVAVEDEDDVRALRRAEREADLLTHAADEFAEPESAPPAAPCEEPAVVPIETEMERELAARLRPVERFAVYVLEVLPSLTLVTEKRGPPKGSRRTVNQALAASAPTAVTPTAEGSLAPALLTVDQNA